LRGLPRLQWLSKPYYPNPHSKTRMPERKQTQAQTSKTWWIPLIIGFMMMVIPGGIFVSPIMFLMAVIMRRNKPKPKSPETSPNSPLPLIYITP